MSTATAIGRYLQLAKGQLKTHTVGTVRCPKRGCILAHVLDIDRQRFLLVHVHSKDRLVKHGQVDGVNATAPRENFPGLTVEILDDMLPGEVLGLVRSGRLKEAHLEELYRASGNNPARIAYLATKEDFTLNHSPNLVARCDHWSGYLPKSALNVFQRVITVNKLTGGDNTR